MARKTVKRVKTGSLERRFSMARAGFLLNIVAIAVLAMAALWLSPVVFGG